jgi:predicted PurR-regulated permease PerM
MVPLRRYDGLEDRLLSPLETERKRVATLFFYGVVIVLGYYLVQIVSPFLSPLGWAAILGIFVYPWHERLIERFGNSRASALTTLIVALLIIGPGVLLLTAFIREGGAALSGLDRDAFAGQLAWAERMWQRVRVLMPGDQPADLGTLLSQATSKAGGMLASHAGGLLANVAQFVFQLFVTVLALFFVLRDADAIMRTIRRALPFEELRRERMIRQARDLVYASVASGFLIAALQGLAGGLTFLLLGLKAPLFWGVVMGFFALLPFVGTWVIWQPAAIWLMATGHMAKGVTLVAIGAGLVSSIDNFVRPMMLAGRTQMNGLLMFISLLGGVSVFGLIGLVLGPLVVAIVSSLFEAYTGSPEILDSTSTPANDRRV